MTPWLIGRGVPRGKVKTELRVFKVGGLARRRLIAEHHEGLRIERYLRPHFLIIVLFSLFVNVDTDVVATKTTTTTTIVVAFVVTEFIIIFSLF